LLERASSEIEGEKYKITKLAENTTTTKLTRCTNFSNPFLE
jgi:hypothetical protein